MTRLVLIRSLDPADFGRVVTTQSLIVLVLTTVSLNISDAVVRFVGVHVRDGSGRAAAVVRQGVRYVAVAGSAGTLFLIALANPIAAYLGLGPAGRLGIALAALAIVPTLLGDTLGSAFQGINRTWARVAGLDGPRALCAVAGYALLASLGWASYPGAMLVQLFAAIAALAIIAAGARRTSEFRAAGASMPLQVLLAYSAPIFISTLVGGTLVGSGIPLLLAARQAPETVALYAVALTMAPLLQLPATALENAALPIWASAASAGHAGDLHPSYAEVTRWGLLLGLIVCVPLMVAPRESLALLFGSEYTGPVAAVEIALGTTLFAVLVGPTEGLLLASGLTRGIVVARVVSGVVALAAAWPLIARWGLTGAIVAWGIQTVLSNAISAGYVFRMYRGWPFDRQYGQTLLAGAAAVVACVAVAATGVAGLSKLLALATASGTAIAAGGWVMGAWTLAELRRIMRQS